MDDPTIAEKINNWLLTNGLELATSLVVALIIIIVGKIAIGIICSQLDKNLKRTSRMSELLRGFLINVINKLLWAIVLMVAIQQLGVNVGPLIAGLGITGFILGFAFQETLGNFASGFMIAINQPFKVGDFVDAGGITGVVKDMNMMAVTLHTPDNKKVVAPNSIIWGSAITNYTALEIRRVDMTAGIGYGEDIGKARDVIMTVLETHEMVLEDPAPQVELVEMADSSVNFVVRPWSKTADYWAVYFSVNRQIKEQLDAAGIEIPFPQMDVHHHGLPQPPQSAS